MNDFPADYQELVAEIKKFITARKEPATILDGIILDLDEKSLEISCDNDFNFYPGSLVLVNEKRGIVAHKKGQNIWVDFEDTSPFRKEQKVSVDTSLLNIILDRLERTVKSIESDHLTEDNRKVLDIILGKAKPVNRICAVDFISPHLNESQKDAIIRSVAADDFHLVVGPPGTGKTYLIQELIQHVVNRGQKVLITAGTNVAVDNILPRIMGVDESQIIRVGSSAGTSPVVKRFTLEEKRKNHPLYQEVRVAEEVIKRGKRDKNALRVEMDGLNQEIKKLVQERDELKESLEGVEEKRGMYQGLLEALEPPRKVDELSAMETVKGELERESDRYYRLARKVEVIRKMDEDLPDSDEFYRIDSELKRMKRTSILRRAASTLNREGYQTFTRDLDNKTQAHHNYVEVYNKYLDLKDQIEDEYWEIYSTDDHKPRDDALETEYQLVEVLDEYLSLKKLEIGYQLENERIKLVADAYQSHLEVLGQEAELLNLEVRSVNTRLHLLINKKETLKKQLRNIQNTLDLRLKRKREWIKKIDGELLSQASVVAATTISTAHPVLDNYQFDTTIMDEASQVASYISLLPLLKSRKFILVGDDNQLQPIEESGLSPELNLSIFNRLITQYPDHHTFLDTQYRMNQRIADISSQMFYQGRLKTHPAVADQTLENFKSPVTFLDTGSLAYEDGIDAGCANAKEAQLVHDIVSLFRDSGIEPREIGVITPYRKQKERITELVDGPEIEVDTVYRFQGREKDVIIFSFCKSRMGPTTPYALRFVEQATQLNVAITRARKKLIIIGNYQTLQGSPRIKQIIDLMGEENRHVCEDIGTDLQTSEARCP